MKTFKSILRVSGVLAIVVVLWFIGAVAIATTIVAPMNIILAFFWGCAIGTLGGQVAYHAWGMGK